jgi:hypothetical protein
MILIVCKSLFGMACKLVVNDRLYIVILGVRAAVDWRRTSSKTERI